MRAQCLIARKFLHDSCKSNRDCSLENKHSKNGCSALKIVYVRKHQPELLLEVKKKEARTAQIQLLMQRSVVGQVRRVLQVVWSMLSVVQIVSGRSHEKVSTEKFRICPARRCIQPLCQIMKRQNGCVAISSAKRGIPMSVACRHGKVLDRHYETYQNMAKSTEKKKFGSYRTA